MRSTGACASFSTSSSNAASFSAPSPRNDLKVGHYILQSKALSRSCSGRKSRGKPPHSKMFGPVDRREGLKPEGLSYRDDLVVRERPVLPP